MDPVDRELVRMLRVNARTTYAELARRVGLSAPAVHERVGKLEASGVVTGYHARVMPSALGLGVTAMVGVFESEQKADRDLAAALAEMPEIEDCWFVAGDESFLVKVRVGDVTALEGTLSRLRKIRGIARTRTTVVLSTKWEGRVADQPS